MPNSFHRRLLAERARALAERGVAADTTLLPPHLVCIAGQRSVALPMGLVASIRPVSCFPLPLLRPGAETTVLGLAMFGHRLASVLDLAQLLAFPGGDDDARSVGKMLLLRGTEIPVALRVRTVLGVMRLQPSVEAGRALLSTERDADGLPELVTMLAADSLLASIASFDAP